MTSRSLSLALLFLSILPRTHARAQENTAEAPGTAMLSHPPESPWWFSAQINLIEQGHGSFHADYSGPNSLSAKAESAGSVVSTLAGGFEIQTGTALLLDVESAGGAGISQALGLAGFTNLDVVRNPALGSSPYVARAEIDQVIPLSGPMESAERDFLHVLRSLPSRRIEIHAGKFSTVDFFDANSAGSDSHLQFMNWTIANNGAYDYAADTRGYTFGVVTELITPNWQVRFGEMMMPAVANGIHFDHEIRKARSENLEAELHTRVAGRSGVIRVLGFVNHARMGSYAEAVDGFLAGRDPIPDITASRSPGRTKYGFGLNLEAAASETVRVFGRGGWNDGATESFAYTEVENTVEAGFDCLGRAWNRAGDRIGVALVSNGLDSEHRRYLELGGLGFLLGDGRLNYGRETILESYYTVHLTRGLSPAVDLQYIDHPGYNRDRGPVLVGSLRLHVEL
jgi:high affinity Mn2+ porin